ncbi:hypothetical protein ALP04_200053 [Pseudomonas amygdali pv. sesami]|nr:hypothetical protein ALP04_200053 [Pseudomonas amygdali pv. sesami]
MKNVCLLTLLTASLFSVGLNTAVASPPSVNLYNWYGIIAPDTPKEPLIYSKTQLLPPDKSRPPERCRDEKSNKSAPP